MSNTKQLQAVSRMPLHLCPPILQIRVAAVMRAGLQNPGRTPYNYRYSKTSLACYLDAAKRHLAALEDGEWIDEKSGEPHAACAAANMAIILDCDLNGTLEHDMPVGTGKISDVLKEYAKKYAEELVQSDESIVQFEVGKDCGDPECRASDCIQRRVERMSERDHARQLLKESDLGATADEASGLSWLEQKGKEIDAAFKRGSDDAQKVAGDPVIPRCYCDESGLSPSTPCRGCPRWGGKEPKRQAQIDF